MKKISKAYVFDFDDVLIKDTAKSKLYNNGKFIKSLNADEYHHYTLQPGDKFDFSEFDNPTSINARPGPVWDLFVGLYKRNKNDLYILTARTATVKPTMLKYLMANGINFNDLHVFCVGNPQMNPIKIPEKKENVLLELLPYYDEIIFYEDNDLTVDRLKDIPGIYPILVK